MEFSKEQLEQYTALLEDWIPKEATIAIAVWDKYIYYAAGERDLQIRVGQQVEKGSIADIVLQNGNRTEGIMDDTLFHAPYYGTGYPIHIQGERGALIVIMPLKLQSHTPFRFLTGKQEEEWRPIPIEKISYMESLQKKTWFYANKEPYKTNIPLKELQLRLPDSFLRIHRSYIVNVSFIDRIIRDFSSNLLILLHDGTELPVSQTYTSEVRNALGF
ncbi:LytR/AlgR family response regulator transcription factor [Psychrobacillus vulpis]|uniref:LytTR family transcriptional regulator n=1 Tax=Psychrobacillus vulpis TaxID=2325572 RepID=A0A544TST8_9BACI|nr:LytTR family DNA-binding domain-containing protein [Psychrobacillus vulpis]TQR20504.1 LytTR family transcriptional regulator [Psychrobacillus vulpis]